MEKMVWAAAFGASYSSARGNELGAMAIALGDAEAAVSAVRRQLKCKPHTSGDRFLHAAAKPAG